MNEESQIVSCADIVNRVFSDIEKTDIQKGNKMLSVWKRTVSGVRGCGENLAEHSRLIDLKNGILLIETDHPGWIQMFQLHKKYILNGLKKNCPEMKIYTLAFRLKGSNAELSYKTDNEDAIRKEKEQMIKSIDNEEEILSGKGFKEKNTSGNKKNEELPVELREIFGRFRRIMLTNSDK
jgi:hypothetical protein